MADFSPSSGGWGSESEASAGEARRKKTKTENASSTVNAATTPKERIRRFACCLEIEAPLNLPDWELRRQLDNDWQIVLRKVARPLQRMGTKQEPAKSGQKTQPAATGQQQGAVPFKAMPWSVKRMLAQATAPSSAPPPKVLRPLPPPPPPPVPMEVSPPWRRQTILRPGPKAFAAQPAAAQRSPSPTIRSPSPKICRGQKHRKRRRRARHHPQQEHSPVARTKRVPDTNGVVAVSLSSDDEPISSSSSRSCSRRSAGSSSSSCSHSSRAEVGTTSKETHLTKETCSEPQLAEAGEKEERGTCKLVPPAEVPEARTPKAGHEAPVMPQLASPSKAIEQIDVEDSDASEGGEPAG